MKLLVFSDSHSSVYNMRRAVSLHPDAAALLHLGDGTADAEYLRAELPTAAFCFIAGNGEEYAAPHGDRARLCCETLLDFGGVKFFLCHGHRLGVKGGTERLAAYADARGADVALFGHTHAPEYAEYKKVDGTLLHLFNPGSIGTGSDPTYGVIEVVGGVAVFSHARINGTRR